MSSTQSYFPSVRQAFVAVAVVAFLALFAGVAFGCANPMNEIPVVEALPEGAYETEEMAVFNGRLSGELHGNSISGPTDRLFAIADSESFYVDLVVEQGEDVLMVRIGTYEDIREIEPDTVLVIGDGVLNGLGCTGPDYGIWTTDTASVNGVATTTQLPNGDTRLLFTLDFGEGSDGSSFGKTAGFVDLRAL